MKISDIEISPIKVSIILLGILVAYFIGDFANSILAAFVIYVLSRRFLLHMVEKKKFNATLASLIINTYYVCSFSATISVNHSSIE